MLQEDVARDSEEIGLEGRTVAHPRLCLQEHQEGPLDQIGRVLARLAAEEPRQSVVEALKEHFSGILVAASPGHQELLIIHHGPAC